MQRTWFQILILFELTLHSLYTYLPLYTFSLRFIITKTDLVLKNTIFYYQKRFCKTVSFRYFFDHELKLTINELRYLIMKMGLLGSRLLSVKYFRISKVIGIFEIF